MDRISYLPLEIRDRILSFLPTTQEAIRTSILSTQWRKVCSTLSNLSFSRYKNPDGFINNVNQTLYLHDNSNIDKFKIFSMLQTDENFVSHLNEWVSFVVNHNVCQLQLWIYVGEIEKLPLCLFTSKTLTSLVLYCVNLLHPILVSLPSLKSCMFSSITFSEQGLSDQFFSNCPVLEDLRIERCTFNNCNIVIVDSPRLKLLEICDSFSDCEIKISSKILNQMTSKGDPRCINLENASALRNAFFTFTHPPSSNITTSRYDNNRCSASGTFIGLSNVAKLTLGGFYTEFLSREQDLLSRLPTSSCLKHLKLDMYRTKNQVQVITFLLRTYSNLQSLHIYVQTHYIYLYSLNTDGYWQTQELYTVGILKHLKTVIIESFEGSDSEFDLVRFLLNNASVIEELQIITSRQKKTDQTNLKHLSEKLKTFSRISPRISILLS